MVIIAVYILLRLFNKKEYYLEGDEVRHLSTAKNFYTLWNKSFYDMHPPFYSWLIRYLKSGAIVSFICSLGLYYISSLLYTEVGLTAYQKTIALTFLTVNYTLIYYSNRIFRYQLIALLGISMVYCLLTHQYILAGILWGLLGLTCVYAGLRMSFAWILLGYNWITLLIYATIFSSWILDKIIIYSKTKYYPSGIEGKIEQVNPFTFKQLLTPFYFKYTYATEGKTQLKYEIKNWATKIGGVYGLYLTPGILTLLPIYFTVLGAFSSPLWLNLLILCLLYPSLLKRFNPRNSIIAIPLLGILLAKWVPVIPLECLYFALGSLLLGFLLFNHHIVSNPIIMAKNASKYINSLPKDGIIADGPVAYFLAYQTDKRVVIIPHERENDIEQLILSIQEFKLNYAVLRLKFEYNEYKVLDFIRINFELIETIQEDDNVYFIYEIPQIYRVTKGQDKTQDFSRVYRSGKPCYN